MKILRYIGLILLLMVYTLRGENEIAQKWNARKEKLMKDPSVSRYYTFEEVTDSKSVVKDLTGKGNNLSFIPIKAKGKIIDDLKVIEGRIPGKKAVRLDRGYYRGEAVEILNKSFTAECWFRRSGESTKHEGFESNINSIIASGGGAAGWCTFPTPKPENFVARISCVPGSSSDGRNRSSYSVRAVGVDIPQDVWHHLVFTWDGKTILLYLNGSLIGKTAHDGEYVPAGRPFLVGINQQEIIDIDEVVIYNRVLTLEEIKESSQGKEEISADKIKNILAKADTFINKKDFKGARKEYETLKNVGGVDYNLQVMLFNIAESYRLEKNYKDAIRTCDDILKLPNLTLGYKVYALFTKAAILKESGQFNKERDIYSEILKVKGISENEHIRANRGIGDTYRSEKQYTKARGVYEKLLKEVESKFNPHEIHRLELIDRLEDIEGLKDGQTEVSLSQARKEKLNMPKKSIYVSLTGNDKNSGTKKSPFATISRAQEEVRKIKKEGGLPSGGIVVYLRGGNYFLKDTVLFTEEDSGTETSPVVYRSYPKEKVRLLGGKPVNNFKKVTNPEILKRLPKESSGKVWVSDLKELGITDYGTLKNRGFGTRQTGALELIYKGNIMTLARYPNDGWLKVAGLVKPEGDYVFRNTPYQIGKFLYSGNRPEKWVDEEEVWIKGYLGPMVPYVVKHAKITSIDTKDRVIYVAEDTRTPNLKDPAYTGSRISKGTSYFAYNLLSELDSPGEWYLSRKEGKLYFWPPDTIKENEVIVSTFDKPVLEFKNVSNNILYNITVEATWRTAVVIDGGENNLIAGCTIRNTGQWGVDIPKGWGHSVVGCDLYDLGEGGVNLSTSGSYNLRSAFAADSRRKLVPQKFSVENNHIYRFNRLCGGNNAAIAIQGIGQRISHNLINDSPHYGISITHNNHIIEFNEIHDIVAHSKELGAIYTWDGGNQLTYRSNIIKNNFLHSIMGHFSPNSSHGVRAVHIDGISSNLTLYGNIFYRTTGASTSSPDSRFDNNIFVDCFPGISQGNRSNLLEKENALTVWGTESLKAFRTVDSKQPPWSLRYPQISGIFDQKNRPLGWPRNITISRNINVGGPFATYAIGLRNDLTIENNITEIDPLFINPEKNDFTIRPGSPVYALARFEPIPFQNIGLYNDELRATWPVEREVGKYFDPTKETGIAKPKEYAVNKRVSPIKIDGKLEKTEWLGLDKSKSISMNTYYIPSQDQKGPESNTWVLYDDKYIYIGTEHTLDPWTEDMPVTVKNLEWVVTEISIEGQVESDTKGWWLPDMATGPIYIFWVFPDGKVQILDSYCKMPENIREELLKNVEYGATMFNQKDFHWTFELKIPMHLLGLNLSELTSTRFNIGVRRRKNWVAWMYADGPIWRLEGGGKLNFIK